MGGFSGWFDGNWFNVAQTAGIIASLLLTATAANREGRSRDIENLLTIAEHHRDLWDKVRQDPKINRISDPKAVVPATADEELFLNEAILQFQTSWRIARIGGLIKLEELATDAKAFFSLPLPRAIWEETKKYRNRKFVRFVQRAVE